MPFYDPDTDILYAAGKGDGNIRYYECVDEKPYVFPLSEYRSTVSTTLALRCFHGEYIPRELYSEDNSWS